jgi:hypothetical protein
MQRWAGNAATRSWLSTTEPAPGQLSVQLQPAPPAAPAAAVAAANADTVHTQDRLTSVLQDMLRSTNRTFRNTAELYTGAAPRLSWTPMTRRSDSAAIATLLGTTGTRKYFFLGVTEPPWAGGPALPPGTKQFEPGVAGTVQGTTAQIRGRSSSGTEYPDRALASFFTHETSHILVALYGEHPVTSTDAASFDRYKDEFRAYFIDPYDSRYADLEPDRRAAAIRTALVGSSATNPNPATHAYNQLQAAYRSNPSFKDHVDRHNRRDGFNLTSSPRLDRLFQILTAAGMDPSKVDDVVVAIIRSRWPNEPRPGAPRSSRRSCSRWPRRRAGESARRSVHRLGPSTPASSTPTTARASPSSTTRWFGATQPSSRQRSSGSPPPSGNACRSTRRRWCSSTGTWTTCEHGPA